MASTNASSQAAGAEKAFSQEAGAKKASLQEAAAELASSQELAAELASSQEMPAQEARANEVPVMEAPAKKALAKEALALQYPGESLYVPAVPWRALGAVGASAPAKGPAERAAAEKAEQWASPATASGDAGTRSFASSRLPPCRYGMECRRKNPDHFVMFSHPPEFRVFPTNSGCTSISLPPQAFEKHAKSWTTQPHKVGQAPDLASAKKLEALATRGKPGPPGPDGQIAPDTLVPTMGQPCLGLATAWTVVWQWKDDRGSWRGFVPEAGKQVEAGFQDFAKHGRPAVFGIKLNDRFSYRMNVVEMTQVNCESKHTRSIRRLMFDGSKAWEASTPLTKTHKDTVITKQKAAVDAAIALLPVDTRQSELRRMRIRFHPDNKDPSLRWLFEALSKHIDTLCS